MQEVTQGSSNECKDSFGISKKTLFVLSKNYRNEYEVRYLSSI